MGYSTTFYGSFDLNKPLTPDHARYLLRFSETRRMARDVNLIASSDPVREAVGLPLGDQGGYYVGSSKDYGQDDTPDILDYNRPPAGQPGLWCQWVPGDEHGNPTDGRQAMTTGLPAIENQLAANPNVFTTITWDEGEKFYYYVEWLRYLIDHFLGPWGYVLNGEVEFEGDNRDDRGLIVVEDNVVKVKRQVVSYEESDE